MKLFDSKNDIEIILPQNADEAVRLAAADLQRDLRRLSGHQNGFPITQTRTDARAIIVDTVAEDTLEAYTVSVEEDRVHIVGTDVLGTVYGIYAFATKYLGILPMAQLIDMFPPQREELDLLPQTITSEARPIRFRGWFLNDEDLLTDFRESNGHREIDYPFYENVMNLEVLDMILEVALRMEINLVIPSSFVNIDNPAEEDLVRAAVRRGLYVSQHHVEPVGVSYFAADAYMKQHGKEGETVSFLGNRARMEEIWRYYIEKWAKYGDRVIWQFGLRGKADQAVWKSDPNVPMDGAARGAIITDAIATQHRIVSEVLGTTDFHSTATLWLEGAELYGKGYLRVPRDTTVIFSDIGHSQMFGDDFYRVTRNPDRRYGVYYHVGFWSDGPHLSEGCDLRKMVFSYGEACRKNSLYYTILNVSNVRPLHFSVWFHAELMKAPDGSRAETTLHDHLIALFGDAAPQIRPLMDAYYDTIADLGKAELQDQCKRRDFYYHDYGALPYPEFPATDGVLRSMGRRMLLGNYYLADDTRFGEVLTDSLARWEVLNNRMQAAEPTLPEHCRLYFAQFLKFETFYMMQMTRWLFHARTMVQTEDAQGKTHAQNAAVDALCSILDARTILERGTWHGWHNGERKINIRELIKLTETTYQKQI